jgi:hypothetical protein
MSCVPSANRLEIFPPSVKPRHAGFLENVRGCLEEVRELPDGFALRFCDDGTLLARLAEWVRLESVCCPFVRFEVRIERRNGPVWLRLTGEEGIKEFLRRDFGIAAAAAR